MVYRKNNHLKIYGMRASEEKTLQMKKPSSSVSLPTAARGVAAEERAKLSAADSQLWNCTAVRKHVKYIQVYTHIMILYSILKC